MESTTVQSNPPEKPAQVNNALNLLYASLAVGIIKSILDLARIASRAPILFTIVTFVITFGILIFLIVKISTGRNWARITMLILFLIGLPFSIPIILQEFSANFVVGILSISQIALQIIALVFLFQSPSNNWFKFKK
ncbi:MAG: hypothetical protein GWN00_37430 [Aliifodinibius sp.]|nr:hypothetical protein [Fodinibius sp.]NIV16302.1 hypothetical protein [Fodinibius sp.]NIY30262.1 hypothetical protein [Fodinibius sp.]